MANKPRAIVAVGDLHAASTMGLMPPTFENDDHNVIHANPVQQWMWQRWLDFWQTTAEYEIDAVIINGDVPNGINSRDAQTITVNESDQIRCAVETLKPLLDLRDKLGFPIYATRGTAFHSGKAGEREESVWREAGAEKDARGRYSRWELWLNWLGKPVFATHHISLGSVYPHTALMRTLRESALKAYGLGYPAPVVDIRSHAHRCHSLEDGGRWIAVSPAWQAPTEFINKVAPGAVTQPGGLIFWRDERDHVQLRKCLFNPTPPVPEELPSKNLLSPSKPRQMTRTATRQRK